MLFNKHFVKPSRFSAGAAQFFNELFETRMESDYAVFLDVDGDKVQAWLPRAEGFVDEAATLIE